MNILHVTPNDNLRDILLNISSPTTIYLKKGVYREKLVIAADNVTLVGEDRETTVLTCADYAKKPHPDGREYNTFRTFTVCVTGENVAINNLTVENSAAAPETQGQSVALSVNARLFRARNVDIKSTQDTLFLAPFPDDLVIRYSGLTDDATYYDGFIPRDQLYMEGESFHYFENCRVAGTVDYVFGGARALFENCAFISLKDKRGIGFVAAPCHSLKQSLGFLFYKCDFEYVGADKSSVYLARPWRDFGKCDFIGCKLDAHIKAELFDKWNDTYRDKTARFAYRDLSGAKIAPVPWAKELTPERANDIIKAFTALKNKYIGE
ncbi:MAG: pectinesterase family protein [Clostridiales bacterium]|nr:pectinesterase family protein [Clostridiales bacterium]